MIRRSTQEWNVGSRVTVGFMRDLTVIEHIPTPGDYAPDAYVLQSSKGTWYRFTPHNGIERCESHEEARS